MNISGSDHTTRNVHALRELMLEMRSAYAPEYGGFLSNHVSQGLQALAYLGAEPPRLRLWVEQYTTRTQLEPRDYSQETAAKIKEVSNMSWEDVAVKFGHDFEALRAFFDLEVARLGCKESLQTYVPKFSLSFAGAALHGAIELGFSLIFPEIKDDPHLLSFGISYLAYTALPWPTDIPAKLDFQGTLLDACEKLSLQFGNCDEILGKEKLGFQSRLTRILSNAQAISAIDSLVPASAEHTSCQILGEAWQLLARNPRDFFILHCVTGSFAMHKICSEVDDAHVRRRLLIHLQRVILGVFLAQRCPLAVPKNLQKRDPHELRARALSEQMADVHLIKLACVALQPDCDFGDDAISVASQVFDTVLVEGYVFDYKRP